MVIQGAIALSAGYTVIEKLMANRPYILVYKDPLLTYLLVSVPSFLTLRYPKSIPSKSLETASFCYAGWFTSVTTFLKVYHHHHVYFFC